MTCNPTYPCVGEWNAPGTVPTIVEAQRPPERDRGGVRLDDRVELDAAEARSRCQATQYSPSRRPTPRPRAAGATMKLAVPMWAPSAGRFGPILAVPSTSPSSSSTTTCASESHRSRPCSEVSPAG